MDQETKAWLEAFETRLIDRIERMEKGLTGVETRLNEKIDLVETRLNEKIERVETALLTEFHKWATPVEMRQRTHTLTLRAIDAEN